MGFYQEINVVRSSPDPRSLFTALRALDATVGIIHFNDTSIYRLKKETAWTTPQITAATNAIINAPNSTPQLSAQTEVDDYPIVMKALVLTLIDEINILRVNAGLVARTPAQAIAAIRSKAATL